MVKNNKNSVSNGDTMDKSFIDDFNRVEVRDTKRCTCKICDRELINEKIVWIMNFM